MGGSPTSVLWNLIRGLLVPTFSQGLEGAHLTVESQTQSIVRPGGWAHTSVWRGTALWGQPGPENQRPVGTHGCDMGGSFRGNTCGWGTSGVTLPLSPETHGLAQGTWPRAEVNRQHGALTHPSLLCPRPHAPALAAICFSGVLPVGDWECLAEETP